MTIHIVVVPSHTQYRGSARHKTALIFHTRNMSAIGILVCSMHIGHMVAFCRNVTFSACTDYMVPSLPFFQTGFEKALPQVCMCIAVCN